MEKKILKKKIKAEKAKAKEKLQAKRDKKEKKGNEYQMEEEEGDKKISHLS
jgi:hypothetical protein